jgi:integrative and conjugative element protein (TIGR02256 family)
MIKVAASHSPNEVGTSLVGSYSSDGFRAEIVGLAPLSDDSRSGRTWFIRGVKGLKEFYERLTKRFRGARHYVGEWHSHPESSPGRSPTDKQTHREIAIDRDANCPEVILVVLGGSSENATLEVCVHSKTRGIVRLAPLN